MCLTMSREQQSPLIKETDEWTKSRVLQKEALEKKVQTAFYECSPKRQNKRRPVVQCLHKESEKPKRLNLIWN